MGSNPNKGMVWAYNGFWFGNQVTVIANSLP